MFTNLKYIGTAYRKYLKTEKKPNYFSWKSMKLGKRRQMKLCEDIYFSGIFTYMLNILLPLEGLCLAAG